MELTLDPIFALGEAAASDIEDIILCFERAYKDDEVFVEVFRGVEPDEIHEWLMKYFSSRLLLPDMTVYKVANKVSGRIVGYTALQFPWDDRPITNEVKAMVTSGDLPPAPGRGNIDALAAFFCVGFAARHGYDPNKDYHRRGTMVHPDFQNGGLGSVLTKYCNTISDKAGRRTFVALRPASVKMFNRLGFKIVGKHDSHLERWGGSRDGSLTFMAVREAELL